MKNKKFIAVGHIVNDTEPHDHLGGGVSYTAVAASLLGLEAHIITKCPKHHPYIEYLSSMGVTVHVLPSSLETIISFKNIYTKSGKRTQFVSSQQEGISQKDFEHFDMSLLKDASIVVAPVIGKVDMDLFSFFKEYGTVSVVPQGYLRKILPSGKVIAQPWEGIEKYAKYIDEIILSDEDMTTDGVFDQDMLRVLRKNTPLVIMTKGPFGSVVFGEQTREISAFPLQEEEIVDFTGAGDVYAAGFITQYSKTQDMHKSAVFASLYASAKITGIGGIGIASIPSKEQLDIFLKNHSEGLKEFLLKNNLKHLPV